MLHHCLLATDTIVCLGSHLTFDLASLVAGCYIGGAFSKHPFVTYPFPPQSDPLRVDFYANWLAICERSLIYLVGKYLIRACYAILAGMDPEYWGCSMPQISLGKLSPAFG